MYNSKTKENEIKFSLHFKIPVISSYYTLNLKSSRVLRRILLLFLRIYLFICLLCVQFSIKHYCFEFEVNNYLNLKKKKRQTRTKCLYLEFIFKFRSVLRRALCIWKRNLW